VATPTTTVSRFLRSGSSIAVAMGIMSIATYGFTMIAARMLGPGSYGALVGMMNTLLVISVLQLGLQATAARRISAEPEHVAQIEDSILRVTRRASLALGALLLVLAPVIDYVLRLDSLRSAALMALTAVPMTMMGGQAGILQGERRWWPLAVLYVANGVPRLFVGTALMVWQPSEFTAMVGVAIGQLVPVTVGWYALRHNRQPAPSSESHRARSVIRETLHNSQALLAFFALSNLDVIVARNVLDDHEAGLYAGGLILTKAVLFLPQFVVVVAFPTMSTAAERRRALTRSLSAVALLGAVATAGAALLPGLALVFVGGKEYAEIEPRLWMFAVLGTLLSMLQLLVYSVIARQGARSIYLVWVTLATLVAAGLLTTSLDGLLTVVLTADALLFAALLAVSLYLVRHPVPAAATMDA
jgi:O-antigen/teichoic acid export membrane protein